MGRRQTGPRPGKDGILYAFLKSQWPDGRVRILQESLKTRDHTTALKRWPAAMDRLKRKANGEDETAADPIRPDDQVWTLSGSGQEVQQAASLWLDDSAFDIDWEQAWDIHAKRKAARSGRALAPSSKRSARNSWKDLGISHPARVTLIDVRDYVGRLQAKGYSPASINQRHGLLAAIHNSLIATGHISHKAENPWPLIDVAFKKVNHHRAATPEELRHLMVAPMTDATRFALKLMIYEGLRIGETSSRTPEHLVNGELIICKTDKWRPKTAASERSLPAPDWCESLPAKLPGITTINSAIKKTLNNDLTSHGLRGAWRSATRVAEIPTEMAEHLLGHAQENVLIDTYGEFLQEAKQAAMEKVWAVLDKWIAD